MTFHIATGSGIPQHDAESQDPLNVIVQKLILTNQSFDHSIPA